MAEDFFKALRERLNGLGVNQSRIAREAGVQQGSLSRFLNGAQESLSGEALVRLVRWLGGEISFERHSEPARDVCFVKPQIVQTDGASPPLAEDYVAAPLVAEVGAGRAYFPEDQVKSWFLAWKHQAAIRHRRNLIAVELAKGSDSMRPSLQPGDIVLVDRDDRDVSQPGRIMLVLDPDGAAMVKRVSVAERGGDFLLTYLSDNAAKWPPVTYSLIQDFNGDWDKAIAGRVIWAWADVRWR